LLSNYLHISPSFPLLGSRNVLFKRHLFPAC
jgi:hypothetical protein